MTQPCSSQSANVQDGLGPTVGKVWAPMSFHEFLLLLLFLTSGPTDVCMPAVCLACCEATPTLLRETLQRQGRDMDEANQFQPGYTAGAQKFMLLQ